MLLSKSGLRRGAFFVNECNPIVVPLFFLGRAFSVRSSFQTAEFRAAASPPMGLRFRSSASNPPPCGLERERGKAA